ncbi:MAG: DsbC family protein [Pseudomonadota bacterium]
MKRLIATIAVCAAALTAPAVAEDDTATALLQERFPQITIERVRPSPMPGVVEVVYGGDQVVYVSEDGRYLLNGALMDLDQQSNLTEATQVEMRALLGPRWLGLFEQLGNDNFLAFGGDAAGPLAGRTITAFTDVTCPWCNRLHNQIDELTQAGVTVNYILFARAGLGSDVHQRHISIWCSSDPQRMLTHAKAGGAVPPAQCENPVDAHMGLVRAVGVNGTPTLVLDNGERVDGFRSAADLIAMLEANGPVKPEYATR